MSHFYPAILSRSKVFLVALSFLQNQRNIFRGKLLSKSILLFIGLFLINSVNAQILNLETTHVNVSCYGGGNGSIELTVKDGTSPYTYDWSNGDKTEDLSGLTAGTYTVTVEDASSQTATATVTITEPPVISLPSATVTSAILCNGGTATVKIITTGGTGALSYTFNGETNTSGEFLGVSAGTDLAYSVTDVNGCSPLDGKIDVSQPNSLAATISSQTDVLCFGSFTGAIDITATGGTGAYTFTWIGTGVNASSEDQTGLAAGNYSVIVTDANGCSTASLPVTITEPASAVSVSLNSKTDVLCFGLSTGAIDITASGGTGAYTYAWTGTGVNASSQDQTGLVAGNYSVIVTDANGCSTASLPVTITEPTSAVSVVLTSQTDVSCFGPSTGAIDITASGGTTPYSYTWTGTGVTPGIEDQTNLAAGNYSVIVTDGNGCSTASLTITITQPTSAVSVSLTSKTDVLCFGLSTGAIDITASGGTGVYTYTWIGSGVNASSEDQTGLAAGNYSVIVTDANGCLTASLPVTITQPASAVSVSLTSKTNVLCYGLSTGAIDITASGGTGAYTYAWTGTGVTAGAADQTGLSAGNYSVIVTDANGCSTASLPVTITEPPSAVSVSLSSHTNVLCYGLSTGAINITATGGTSAYTYTWIGAGVNASSQDQTGLAAGNYSVIVTDANGCSTASLAITLTQPATAVSIGSISSNTPICEGSNLNFTSSASGGIGALTYAWTGPNSFTSAAQNPSITNATVAASGIYNLIVTDGNSCSTLASTTSVTVNALPTASLSGTTTICNGGNATLILTVTGSGTISGNLTDGTNTIPFSGTAPSITVNVSPSTNTNYSITSLVDAHCTGVSMTGSATITVNQRPTAVLSGTQTICSGGTATLTFAATGTGTISGTLSDGTTFSGTAPTFTVNVSPIATTSYTIASLTNGSCPSIAADMNGGATITVNPRPTAVLSGSASVCSGESAILSLAVTGTGTISGTLSGGIPFSGTAPTILVSVTPASTSTYTVATLKDGIPNNCTATSGDWSGSATVTIKPKPVAVASSATQTICSGSPINQITLSTSPNVPGTQFNWTKDHPEITGITSPNSGNINGSLTNSGTDPVTVTFTVIPTVNGCEGAAISPKVVVNPIPVLSSLLTAPGRCNNKKIIYTPTSNTTGASFKWTRAAVAGISNAAVTTPQSGAPNEQLNNTTNSTINVVYKFTISYTNGGKTCTNVQSVVVPVYSTLKTVSISASQFVCIGSSAAPLTAIITGGNQDDYTYDWEVSEGNLSWSWDCWCFQWSYGSWKNAPGGPGVQDAPTYTPKAQNKYRLIVRDNCGGVKTSNEVTIAFGAELGNVLNTPPDATICSESGYFTNNTELDWSIGEAFAGTVDYKWNSQDPGFITSPTVASGVTYGGNRASHFLGTADFYGHNPTNAPITKNLVIIPTAHNFLNSCQLSSIIVPVTINPVPKISTPRAVVVCSDEPFNATPVNGVPNASTIVPANTTYTWAIPTSIPTGLTGATAGTNATSISQTLTNSTGNQLSVKYIITPTYDGECAGASFELTVKVNPTPTISSITDKAVCNSSVSSAIPFVANTTTNTTFTWTNSKPTINLSASGTTNNIPSFTAANNGNTPVTANIEVFPSYSKDGKACAPSVGTKFDIIVNPTPVMNAITAKSFCDNVLTGDIPFGSSTLDANTFYTWTNTNTAIGLGVTGNTNSPNNKIASFTATNSNTDGTSITGTISVKPFYGSAAGCVGTAKNFVITVKPTLTAGPISGNSLVCIGDGSTFTTTGGNTGGTWSSSQTTVATINATTGKINATASGNTTITYSIAGCNGTSSTTFPLSVSTSGQWRGITANWNDVQNWCNGVPDLTTNVNILPLGPGLYAPVIDATSGVGKARNISIGSGATLTVIGQTLEIAGSITDYGVNNIDATSGTLEFKGTGGAQAMSGSWFQNNTVANLIVSNNVNVSTAENNSLNITGEISFINNPNTTLSSGDNLTLKSTAAGTASVGVLSANNDITGNVTVERYIPADTHGKSWQLLATPTKGQTIKAAWQEGASLSNVDYPTTNTSSNPHPGYGTMIVSAKGGNATGARSLGFDEFTAPGPSMKTYLPATNTYDAGPASTNDLIYNPKGYLVLVRGDRSVNAYNIPANATTLRTKGTLFTPARPPASITATVGEFESIGNPYASPLDLRKLSPSGGMSEIYYVWDPKLGSYYNLGAFQTLVQSGDFGDDNFYPTPGGGSYSTGTAHNYIESGQAFIVGLNTLPGSLSFSESDKYTAPIGSTTMLRGDGTKARQAQLRTNLYSLSNGAEELVDGVLIQYNQAYSNGVDKLDARKATNSSENLAIKSGGKDLVIERRSPIVESDTIFYKLTTVKVQKYRYEYIASNLGEFGVEGIIEDAYLGTKTPLNMEGKTTVDFTIVNIPGSYAADRFRIVFKAAAGPLPVTFVSVKAAQQEDDITVDWKVENEHNLKAYEVEKSLDGVRFVKTSLVPAGNNGVGAYTWLDKDVTAGWNYYRIKSIDVDGKVSYSEVVKVQVEMIVPLITVYPNPIVNGVINVHLVNQPAGNYKLRLLNALGQTMVAKQITREKGTSIEPLTWDYKLARGNYRIEVTKPDGGVKLITVIY